MEQADIYDILVAGGGPAGLTAALYAARAGRRVAVLEKAAAGGQILNAPLVENYPALPRISGADLAGQLLAQAEALGAELRYEEVLRAEALPETAGGPRFRLTTDAGVLMCRALILATGTVHRTLALPEEAALLGRGVSCCAVCDGAFYAGKQVAVVGGGDTALQDALFLSELCGKVTVLVRRDRFRGEPLRAAALARKPNVEIRFGRSVAAYETDGGGELRALRLRDGDGALSELPVEGVLLAVGQSPDTAAFASLAETDAQGYLVAGEDTRTAVPGLFAAGDCRTKGVRQLVSAAADGAAAALAACGFLELQTPWAG